jgi:hypothetical protein
MDEPIRLNLYAYTDYGAWLVHGMPGVEYQPTPTAALAQGVSTVGAPGDLQIAGVAPDEDTPFPRSTPKCRCGRRPQPAFK